MLSDVKESLYTNNAKSKLNKTILFGSIGLSIVNILIVLVLVVLIFELIFSITYSGVYIVGDSMKPTLIGAVENSLGVADTSGDYVYVNKYATPDYGDIVVVNKTKEVTIVKRVIAKGGDYVKMDHGAVYVRHSSEEPFAEPLIEDYVDSDNNHADYRNNTFHNDDIGYYIEEGYYFVLGDNRDVSLDSRENNGTCFEEKQIFGVVTEWSIKNKSIFTSLHKYLSFDLPSYFGIDNRVKRNKAS